MIEGITHLGIAVKDLDSAVDVYRRLLGVDQECIEELPDRGVRVAIFRVGHVEIELFEPLGPEGNTVRRFLAKRGEGIHHICGEVADLAEELERLKKAGFTPVGPPRRGAGGRLVAFLRPISGVLFELSEKL
jgi:methylmalonyl-CoA/ethylmalonyl-CoA epimerase